MARFVLLVLLVVPCLCNEPTTKQQLKRNAAHSHDIDKTATERCAAKVHPGGGCRQFDVCCKGQGQDLQAVCSASGSKCVKINGGVKKRQYGGRYGNNHNSRVTWDSSDEYMIRLIQNACASACSPYNPFGRRSSCYRCETCCREEGQERFLDFPMTADCDTMRCVPDGANSIKGFGALSLLLALAVAYFT